MTKQENEDLWHKALEEAASIADQVTRLRVPRAFEIELHGAGSPEELATLKLRSSGST
jgi:hypothetical protein